MSAHRVTRADLGAESLRTHTPRRNWELCDIYLVMDLRYDAGISILCSTSLLSFPLPHSLLQHSYTHFLENTSIMAPARTEPPFPMYNDPHTPTPLKTKPVDLSIFPDGLKTSKPLVNTHPSMTN